METKKFCLTERQMPTQWYNIVADMPNKPLPPLHPATKQPVTKEQMSAIFAEELIDQEMSTERFIDIPEEVQEIYKIWRPSPLVRATGLEKALGTPGKDLFQERKRIARRIAQAQHRRAAGLLQLQAGHTPPDDRNGRRAVGRGHRLRSQAFRARRAGFHGEGQLRTETLPAADDEHVGRRVHRVAQHNHRLGPRSARTRPPTAREASGWRSRRPWRWLCNTRRTPATAWAAC